jgi:hypothetical protein
MPAQARIQYTQSILYIGFFVFYQTYWGVRENGRFSKIKCIQFSTLTYTKFNPTYISIVINEMQLFLASII